ncbi:hypothetical protein [Rhodoferax sp. BLA1]|uniref:hypothetical protein n=1 Tax=Rhodoferax sp. BLA1 TaxID=2576062 RepID=UPI0015D36A46|nr:hypothetical protein [Rhodoferax sp. BLA1]
MHPLLALLATRPQLLVDHAQAYAALFSEEFGLARATWQRQVLLYAAALCALGVAAVLAGVATMLWFATAAPAQSLWVLLAVPTVPLLVAVVCLLLARQPAPSASFASLGRQINEDMAMLRAVGEP